MLRVLTLALTLALTPPALTPHPPPARRRGGPRSGSGGSGLRVRSFRSFGRSSFKRPPFLVQMAMLEITLSLESEEEASLIVEHQAVEFVCAAPAGARLELAIGGLALEPFLRPGDPTWRWRWN